MKSGYKVKWIKATFLNTDSVAIECHETKFKVPPTLRLIVNIESMAKKFLKGNKNRVSYTEVMTDKGKFVYFCTGKLI